ncbi:MAG: bifunctional tetrahydrofolate synthase/dihydrofolate synthase [Methylococcaceae bacterium]|nr:bifunctional tetrahydrofolate synthase/dihydrofolate synthase [Methylococcaceae bacterium]
MNQFVSLTEWLEWQESLHPLPIDLGLERVKCVFEALLPNYKKQKPLTITVTGTNGKGSTVAYLEQFYLASGHKVGAYTSPHILRYNERIKINGESVSDELICAAFEQIDLVRGETSLSYFEFSTLAALLIFSQQNVVLQVLEVGLGGRLDAVNIVDTDMAIVTSIAIDHVEYLGETRDEIGLEKAGIFRRNTPAIVSDLRPPTSLLNYAYKNNVLLLRLGETFFYEKHGETWTWQGMSQTISDLPNPALKGNHQFRNASAAIFATQCLADILPVSETSLKMGLKNVKLAGRFQLIEGDVPILLDVGHNPQAVETLVNYLDENFPNSRIHAIFSMMKDKDITGVLELMKPVVFDWFFVPLPQNPRAVTESAILKFFEQCHISAVNTDFKNFPQAFTAAKNHAQHGDLILVFGSFFLVSDCCANLKIGE